MSNVQFLSGVRINFETDLIYEAFLSEKMYLGFARNTSVWGQSSLIKVRPPSNKNFPQDFLLYDNDSLPLSKYTDKNTNLICSNIPSGSNRIFIAKLPKNLEGSTNINDYIFIDENEIGQIYLKYINNFWLEVEGLNPKYQFDRDMLYYVFNYNKDLSTKFLIEDTKIQRFSSITMPVKLAYSLTNEYIPTSILNCGNLTRTLNDLGEVEITGLNPNFELDNNLINANFFILDENNQVMLDRIKYIETIVSESTKLLIFEYKSINTTNRFAITTDLNSYQTKSVFNESLPIDAIEPVSDNNPPKLAYSYINENLLKYSINEIVGLSKIFASEVYFVRQVLDPQDEANLIEYGFTIDTLVVDDNEIPTTLKIAKTQNKNLALQFNCENVMIQKSLNNITPTDDIYRQLFISYNPKDSNGNSCTLDNYTNIFNVNKYSNDIGTLVYLANKIPLYRRYIATNEEFKIII